MWGMDPDDWWEHVMRHTSPDPAPSSEDRRYVCPKCKQELQLDYVKSVEAIPAGLDQPLHATMIRVVHACPCQAWVRRTRYPFDDVALARLFGTVHYYLPWPRAGGRDETGEVVDRPPSEPTVEERNEALMERWRFDLEGVDTAHDFLLFCRGPRHDLIDGA